VANSDFWKCLLSKSENIRNRSLWWSRKEVELQYLGGTYGNRFVRMNGRCNLSRIVCTTLFGLIYLFWKNRVGLWDHVAVCVCVCVCLSPLSLLGNGSVKIFLTVARRRLCKNPPIVARQRLGRNFTAVTNTHATTKESFSIWPGSYEGE
jgi:hypothetical protein